MLRQRIFVELLIVKNVSIAIKFYRVRQTDNHVVCLCAFHQDNASYQSDLLQQIEFQKQLKEFETEEVKRELELQKEAETLHQLRVQEALARPHQDKIHPKRLLVTGQGVL